MTSVASPTTSPRRASAATTRASRRPRPRTTAGRPGLLPGALGLRLAFSDEFQDLTIPIGNNGFQTDLQPTGNIGLDETWDLATPGVGCRIRAPEP
eukprot:15096455-Alexandrium_andersonii.AAC.1